MKNEGTEGNKERQIPEERRGQRINRGIGGCRKGNRESWITEGIKRTKNKREKGQENGDE